MGQHHLFIVNNTPKYAFEKSTTMLDDGGITINISLPAVDVITIMVVSKFLISS